MKNRQLISDFSLLLVAVLAVTLLIVINANLTGIRLDLTESKLFTLSDGTINIIKSLEEPVSLDFYFSRKTLVSYPSIMNYGNRVRDLLREYAAKSGGKIKLTIIEPEPFSEQEDQAVASGLQGVPVNTSGDLAYFGLVGVNSVDDERVIPFFQNNKEASLEYDLTKLIYNLANPEKRVIGIISSLPIFGNRMRPQENPWTIVSFMKEFFEVKDLGTSVDKVDDDVDVLMIIHPKDLTDTTLFAIDQFLLAGGKTMIFVDPLAESDQSQPDPQNPMVMPKVDSDLKTLFDTWGLEIPHGKVAGDIKSAMRVQTQGPRGPQESLYLSWLRIDERSLNREDFATNELESIHMGSAGTLQQSSDSTVEFIPLIESSAESMLIDSDLLRFQPDPNNLLKNFVPDGNKKVLAARISGEVNTAFPDGKPEEEGEEKKTGDRSSLSKGHINAIVVADTDILNDIFWVRKQNFFGMEIPQIIANNGDFIINALDNLAGNNDLISLRSRGRFSRPFTLVEEIRRQAENEFRDRERQLQARLKETEQRIVELQKDTSSSALILSPEQTKEIEKFRLEQLNTRKELRAVQHELQKNIERLGSLLKFINIALVPILIIVIAVSMVYFGSRRREKHSKQTA